MGNRQALHQVTCNSMEFRKRMTESIRARVKGRLIVHDSGTDAASRGAGTVWTWSFCGRIKPQTCARHKTKLSFQATLMVLLRG